MKLCQQWSCLLVHLQDHEPESQQNHTRHWVFAIGLINPIHQSLLPLSTKTLPTISRFLIPREKQEKMSRENEKNSRKIPQQPPNFFNLYATIFNPILKIQYSVLLDIPMYCFGNIYIKQTIIAT